MADRERPRARCAWNAKFKMSSSPLAAVPLICPLDGLALRPEAGCLRCAAHHAFDLSAAGYVNLLPAQHKASREPGDSKAMVSARRRVLEAGLFSPVADLTAEAAHQALVGVDHLLLMDAGCGEGDYTARITHQLRDGRRDLQVVPVGVDISKWAVLAAAKRYPDMAWVVASNRRLPVAQGSAGLICSLFGFPMWAPWSDLQEPGQLVITVDAGARHLIELRDIIYPSTRAQDPPRPEAARSSGYELIAETRASYVREIGDWRVLDDILEMTPHGHKISPAARAQIQDVPSLRLTFDAIVRTFRRP